MLSLDLFLRLFCLRLIYHFFKPHRYQCSRNYFWQHIGHCQYRYVSSDCCYGHYFVDFINILERFAVGFFDEIQAKAVGLSSKYYKLLFFSLLSACVVSALQTVGAILVIAMVITPGATAYQLTDKFRTLILIAGAIGVITGGFGVYLSYFLDGATGGIIVCLQTALFIIAFCFHLSTVS